MAYNPLNYNWTVAPGEERHGGSAESSGKLKFTKRYIIVGEFLGSPTTVDAAWGASSGVELAIYDLDDVPQPFESFPNMTSMTVVSRNHDRLIANPLVATYVMDVEYETADPQKIDPPENEEPEDLDDKWSTDTFTIQMTFNTDCNGTTVKNAAGEILQNPPQTTIYGTIWRVQRYRRISAINIKEIKAAYEGVVNSAAWNGYGENTVLCDQISARQEKKKGVDYWNMQFSFRYWEFDAGPVLGMISWMPTHVLNCGYNELVAGNLKRILDDATPPQPVVTPQLLTAAGARAAVGAEANYLEFYYHTSNDLTPLGMTIPGTT